MGCPDKKREARLKRGFWEVALKKVCFVSWKFRVCWSRQELGGQKTSVWLLGAELGRSEHAQSLILFSLPFTMISRTGVRSIRFLSISVMSGCSLAPSMNSSNVNSPVGVKGQPSHSDKSSCIWNDSVNQLVWRDFLMSDTVLVATATKWSTLHFTCVAQVPIVSRQVSAPVWTLEKAHLHPSHRSSQRWAPQSLQGQFPCFVWCPGWPVGGDKNRQQLFQFRRRFARLVFITRNHCKDSILTLFQTQRLEM